ncbi:hypothetical protein [Erwinia amylovora]|uniref:hypothetical protein n=1 Tax=Erwinia amylovora TaxID=552 RepID=UPI003D05B4E2
MANWWDDAPLVEQPKAPQQEAAGKWWESAPLVEQKEVYNDGSLGPTYARGGTADGLKLAAGGDMRNQQLAASRGAVEGLPVVGPYIASGVEHLAAGLRAPFTGKSYDEELAAIQERANYAKEANPGLTTVGNVTGGVLGSAAMVGAAPALMGARGATLFGKTLASTGSGAVIGAADSGVRSDFDPDAMKNGAYWGFGTGLLGPAIGQGIGAGVRKVADSMLRRGAAQSAGMTPAALQLLERGVARDGLDAPAMQSRLAQMGPDAMVMDLGPNLQHQAGALAATPGRGQEIVRDALNRRQAGANQRILGDLDETLGRSRSPVQLDEGLRDSQGLVGPAYEQSFENAVPVQTGYIADTLDHQARTLRGPQQRSAEQVRQMLNETGRDTLDTNPRTLLQTRNAIDGMMTGETNPQVIRTLAEARQQIDENLARNVPNIKMADAQYEELGRQRSALDRGSQILDSGKTTPRPEDFANEVQAGANPQGLMVGPSGATFRMSQGARAEIDRILGTKANDVVGLAQAIKGDGDWNRAKLVSLFGEDKTRRIIDVLEREKTYANTRQVATQNSETAARQQAIKEINPGQNGEFGPRQVFEVGGFKGLVRSIGLKGADKVAAALKNANIEGRNAQIADALTSNNQRIIEAITRMQGRSAVPQSKIDSVSRALLLSGGVTAGR